MKAIAVAGGLYGERCLNPDVDELFGSGGRAAMALARAGHKVDWHYYCPDEQSSAIQLTLVNAGLVHNPHSSAELITFVYDHPLARPVFYPGKIQSGPSIHVEGENILRFGMMEGDAVVVATNCVFDPQTSSNPQPFGSNGSRAKNLALVLNEAEVLRYASAPDEVTAVQRIVEAQPGSVVLVKAGANGCRVYERGRLSGSVPPYWSDRVYKIGTGDVFTAAFAGNWMLNGKSCLEAADIASQCVSYYTESRTPTVSLEGASNQRKPIAVNQTGLVYLAGPIFTMAELWMIDQVTVALESLSMTVFSPYRDVGFGDPTAVVAGDLEGLEKATAIFACIDGTDPGTLFEVGYAVKKGIPVICYSQNPKPSDLTMMLGSKGCYIYDDFASAAYHAVWWARQ